MVYVALRALWTVQSSELHVWPTADSKVALQTHLLEVLQAKDVGMTAGAKDMLVLPELNALSGVWPEELTVEADVRDMPGVWVSADHQVLFLLLCSSSAL